MVIIESSVTLLTWLGDNLQVYLGALGPLKRMPANKFRPGIPSD